MNPVSGPDLDSARLSGLGHGVVTYALFPLNFVGALVFASVGLSQGWGPGLILVSVTVFTMAVVAIVERIHPEYPAWNQSRGDVGVDAIHGLVSMVALPKLLELALHTALLVVASRLAQQAGSELWPHAWPLFAQVVLAMLISQFGEYWIHRLSHTTPLLWRLHATHHSPHRLYFFNAGRFHPLDTAIGYGLGIVPLLLLGAGPEVFVLHSTWIGVHGLYQHCNIHLRLGPLNYVFSMAELHRWHHSLILEEANRNYGNNLIVYDLLFGTFFHPSDRDASEAVGLADMPDFPQDYLGQLASPLRWPGG
jgi:sterol desaturase/sphingolipid hydroxylase (fatty acid hydroxylase superfamily)